jgi:hypothetical protein
MMREARFDSSNPAETDRRRSWCGAAGHALPVSRLNQWQQAQTTLAISSGQSVPLAQAKFFSLAGQLQALSHGKAHPKNPQNDASQPAKSVAPPVDCHPNSESDLKITLEASTCKAGEVRFTTGME